MCNSLLTRCPGSQGALGAQQGYRQSNGSCDIEENYYVRPNCNLVRGAWEIWFGYGILLLNPYYQIDIYIICLYTVYIMLHCDIGLKKHVVGNWAQWHREPQ